MLLLRVKPDPDVLGRSICKYYSGMTNSRNSFKCLKTEQLIIDNYKLFCSDHLTIATYFHSTADLSWNLQSWSVLHLQITRMITSIKTLFTLPRPWFSYFYPLNVNCQNNCWTETMWLLLWSFSLNLEFNCPKTNLIEFLVITVTSSSSSPWSPI